jgi:hypothetical protein
VGGKEVKEVKGDSQYNRLDAEELPQRIYRCEQVASSMVEERQYMATS